LIVISSLVISSIGAAACTSAGSDESGSGANAVRQDDGQPSQVDLPEVEPGSSDRAKAIAANFSGCYEIGSVKTEPDAVPETSFAGRSHPSVKYVCISTKRATNSYDPGTGEQLAVQLHLNSDGIEHALGTAGFLGKDSGQLDSMTMYHPWFFEAQRLTKVSENEYKLEFFQTKGVRPFTLQLDSTITLKKLGASPNFAIPTADQLERIRKRLGGCYDFTEKSLLGDWSTIPVQEGSAKAAREFCVTISDIKSSIESGVYGRASIKANGHPPLVVDFRGVDILSGLDLNGNPESDYNVMEHADKLERGTYVSSERESEDKVHGDFIIGAGTDAFVSFTGKRKASAK